MLHHILLRPAISACSAFCLSVLFYLLTATITVHAQPNGPWNAPLLVAEEIAPDVFGEPRVFQDSSGVPCVVRKPGTDSMWCVFQWFRAPRNGPTWDKVAVKVSADEGATWSEPTPIVVAGLPQGYQRPFDPTIVWFGDSIRIYFSSSARMSMAGLDSVVNTYSAVGVDGVHYIYEPGIRFDNATRPVIDPAVHYAQGNWRYIAPIGAPQDGAYQGISSDGLVFTQMDNITSDNTHNWTGNLMSDETGHMHFYGSGPELWRSPDSVFGRWGTYRMLGLRGGDPSAVQRTNGTRMIIYVGPRYVTSVDDGVATPQTFLHTPYRVFPNPTHGYVNISSPLPNHVVHILSAEGIVWVLSEASGVVKINALPAGVYVLRTCEGVLIDRLVVLN